MESSPDVPAATAQSPQPPKHTPTQQSLFWTQSDKSLESFAITTTPFHDADEDGEYYMDEAGNWLQRWATKTEVQAAKPASRPDSGYQEAALESSGSSEEERRQRHESAQSRGRPRLQRNSRSSFIPSDKANHRSPAPSSSPKMHNDEGFQLESMQAPNEVDAGLDSTKAFSAPSSPRQRPVPFSQNSALSHSRRSSQPQQARPQLRSRHTAGSYSLSRHSSTVASNLASPISTSSSYARLRSSRPWSAAEDPYVAHREALAIFAPRTASTETEVEKTTAPKRVVQAADFLAERSNSTLPIRPASKSSSVSTAHSITQVQGSVVEKEDEGNKNIILRDNDVTIDWTHPETRRRREEKELKRRSGLRGKMRKIANQLKGKSGNSKAKDDGSVRRLKMH